MLKLIITIIYLLLFTKIFYIFGLSMQNLMSKLFSEDIKLLENFDTAKIKTKEHALKRIKEFNYTDAGQYLDKYFIPMKVIDLRKIPLIHNGKIFCSIASFRDKQCPMTIKDIIDKSRNPELLVICICQQNDNNEDVDCLHEYQHRNGTIVKIQRLTDREARGPCWARYLIQQEWRGEEYFLQIDSHTRFEKDWDFYCKEDIKNLPEKSCLTNYVSNFNLNTGELPKVNSHRGGMFIVDKATNEEDGFFRVNSDYVNGLDKPEVSRGWSGCFSFSTSDILQDAGYDPYTPFLFFGEEMDIWARMFTHGWHVYAPTHPICFTNFDRSYRPTFWSNPHQHPVEILSRIRLYYKFGYLKDIPPELKIGLEGYSLGKKKTFQQFLEFCLDDLDVEPLTSSSYGTHSMNENNKNFKLEYLDIQPVKSDKNFKYVE